MRVAFLDEVIPGLKTVAGIYDTQQTHTQDWMREAERTWKVLAENLEGGGAGKDLLDKIRGVNAGTSSETLKAISGEVSKFISDSVNSGKIDQSLAMDWRRYGESIEKYDAQRTLDKFYREQNNRIVERIAQLEHLDPMMRAVLRNISDKSL
jgi:hypothetical protein